KSVTIALCDADKATCGPGDCTCPTSSGEGAESDVLVNIEDANGGSGDDTILGNAGPNQLDGNAGNDSVDGQGGNAQLDGDDGDDTLLGGDGDDTLIGNAGKVAFDGQGGDNICVCGAAPKSMAHCAFKAGCN